MGCLRVLLAALSKVFRKASLSLIPEATILTTSKVCCVQYLLVFRLISGYTDERLIPGLRQKDWILRALLLAVTSLWPHKVGSRDKNLFGEMEIDADFWPGQTLIKKNCLDDVSPESVEVLWVVFASVVIAEKVIYCVIYRKCRQTNLRYVRLGSCYQNTLCQA